ncbi:hypothetical protein MGG_16583 [Pyricularia oryzae 70-15]|uniref:Uncharacterized protein n=1 Tax=Pyricularia oryzae (strain 70-15 / ATCC MYA-4617 / FGSC 8958) TaxID=242507 RepID=G4N5F9_PYRO7|nr:uncharacterized protein MGG_16583 [Pyricularia oryzae 70-15]EHA51359.1 hypothetical protein MGG_16583 [Pyricularia oryzae 70-15]
MFDKKKAFTVSRIVTLGLWELFVTVGSGVPGCAFVIYGFDKYVTIVSIAQYGDSIPRELLLRNLMSWGLVEVY